MQIIGVMDNLQFNHYFEKDRTALKHGIECKLLELLTDRVVAHSGSAAIPDLVTAFFAPSHQRPQNQLGVEADSDEEPVRISTQAIKHGRLVIEKFVDACFKSNQAFFPALRSYLASKDKQYKLFLPSSVRLRFNPLAFILKFQSFLFG